MKNSAHGKRKAIFIFLVRRGDFHGRMAVCGNAALNLFIGPLSLALRARCFLLILGPGLYLRDHFLLKLFKTSMAPTLDVSAVSHDTSS